MKNTLLSLLMVMSFSGLLFSENSSELEGLWESGSNLWNIVFETQDADSVGYQNFQLTLNEDDFSGYLVSAGEMLAVEYLCDEMQCLTLYRYQTDGETVSLSEFYTYMEDQNGKGKYLNSTGDSQNFPSELTLTYKAGPIAKD